MMMKTWVIHREHTFLYGWSLQHLLVVRIVESTFRPEGDLPLHFLKTEMGDVLI